MYNHTNSQTGEPAPLVSTEFFDFVMGNAEQLDSAIIYDRDFDYDYFGFKVRHTAGSSCLASADGVLEFHCVPCKPSDTPHCYPPDPGALLPAEGQWQDC